MKTDKYETPMSRDCHIVHFGTKEENRVHNKRTPGHVNIRVIFLVFGNSQSYLLMRYKFRLALFILLSHDEF